jgi:tRNA nucleotidyltransferase (CCA-adding enzyme)
MRDRALFAVLNELQEVLPRFVKPSLTVRDLMSYSVRTVTPEAHVSEVAQRMIHTGHEGFPVVNKQGQVVGLITRNAVDRAIQHKWESQPVRRIMEAGEISVSPGDSAQHVRALMIQRVGPDPGDRGKQIVGS